MHYMGKMIAVTSKHKVAGKIRDVGGTQMRASEKFSVFWDWWPYDASPKDFYDILVNDHTRWYMLDKHYGELHWHYYVEKKHKNSNSYEGATHEEYEVTKENWEQKIEGNVRVEFFYHAANDQVILETYRPLMNYIKHAKATQEKKEGKQFNPLLWKTRLIAPFIHYIPESITTFDMKDWLRHLARELVDPSKVPARKKQYTLKLWITVHSDGIGRSLHAATFFTGKIFVTEVPEWLEETGAIPKLKTRTFVIGGMRGKDNNTRKYLEPILFELILTCGEDRSRYVTAGPDKDLLLEYSPSRILISMDFASIAEATGVKAARLCPGRGTFGAQKIREMGCIQYHVPNDKTTHTLNEFAERFEEEEKARAKIKEDGGSIKESDWAFRKDRLGPICYHFLYLLEGAKEAQISPTVFHNTTGFQTLATDMIKDYSMIRTQKEEFRSFLKEIESAQQLGTKGMSTCSGQQIIEAVEVYSKAFSASIKPEFGGWKYWLEIIAASSRWLTSGEVWHDSEFSCFLAYQSASWIQFVELSDWQGGRKKPETPKETGTPWYMGKGFIYVAGFFSHIPQFLIRNRLAPLLWNEINDEKSFTGYPAISEKLRNAAPIARFAWWKNCLDELKRSLKNKLYGKRLTQPKHHIHFGSIAFFPCVFNDDRGAACLCQLLAMLDEHEEKCKELGNGSPHNVTVHTDGCLLMEPCGDFRYKKKGVIGVCICRDSPCLQDWEESYSKETMRALDDRYRELVMNKARMCPSDRKWMAIRLAKRTFEQYMANKKGYAEMHYEEPDE